MSGYASVLRPESTDNIYDVLQDLVYNVTAAFEKFRESKWNFPFGSDAIDTADSALLELAEAAQLVDVIALKLHEAFAQFNDVIVGWGRPVVEPEESTESVTVGLPGDELTEDPFAEY